jgi:hypothetical protein
MNQEKVSINISRTLYDKISAALKDDRKEAVEDFVAIVLQNYFEEDAAADIDEDLVEKRLKDLGYL